jgi:hypothetical protein
MRLLSPALAIQGTALFSRHIKVPARMALQTIWLAFETHAGATARKKIRVEGWSDERACQPALASHPHVVLGKTTPSPVFNCLQNRGVQETKLCQTLKTIRKSQKCRH